jgi:hypothetical protein
MFILHDDASLQSRLYYGVEGLQYSGLWCFLSFQGLASTSEMVEPNSWWVLALLARSIALIHDYAGVCARKRSNFVCCSSITAEKKA